jgi:cytidylate kinase
LRERGIIVAIDGPGASGKSTTTKLVAQALGYTYLDTGAMYRAVTCLALEWKVDPSDAEALAAIAGSMDFRFEGGPDDVRVLVDGHDRSEDIRTPDVTRHVSEVSAHPEVRRALVSLQRDLGAEGGIVAEGRDMTTVVFPDAEVKVYLDASLDVRAKRRALDFETQGTETTVEEQQDEIAARDRKDSSRAHSPLSRATDAVVVDTTGLTIEQQVEEVLKLARQAGAR